MRGLVGIARLPKGGFGNRLWAYLNLRSIAEITESSYFSKNPVDVRRVRGINRRPKLPLSARRVAEIWPRHLEEGHLVSQIQDYLFEGRVVSLRGPMLGEVFAELAQSPNSIREDILTRRCDSALRASGGERLGVLHLRGGDFADWDPTAILSSDYYLQSVEIVLEHAGSMHFRICTDDPRHPALASVKQHLSSKGLLVADHDCAQPLECDFSAMVESESLISSPSTFSILAGIIGTPFITQSRSWAENRAEKGELFWQLAVSGKLIGYPVSALV